MSEAQETVFQNAIKNFLHPIAEFLSDSTVTEIMINGPQEIFVERGGKLFRTPARFHDEDSLRAAINNIAQSVGRRIDNEEPRLDARLPDGSRICAVIPPCSLRGTVVAIRKFSKVKMTFREYLRLGSITTEAAQFLDICMFLGKNILVSGGTGSGKTTLLSVLCGRIPPSQRVIIIEDSSELEVDYEHVVRFETRMADQEGKGEVTIRDLLKSSLRLRPDRIIVGEVRGGEAMELVSAMNTGHKGCMGTVHANSPYDAIIRLEALALGAEGKMSERALQQQIGSAVNLIVQISRMSDGSRRILEISEVGGLTEAGKYHLTSLFVMGPLIRQADGKLNGALQPTGNLPSFMNEIEENKIPFGPEKFNPKKVG